MFSVPLAEQVRPHFPALQRQVHGRPVAFFDGPGGTQVPSAVIDAVAGYLANHNANTHGEFATSGETDLMIRSARARFADFLGAASASEVVFGANMTSLTFSLSRALGDRWSSGDQLIVTQLDHQANIAPWRRIAEERGLRLHVVPFHPDTLTLDYENLDAALDGRTRLVAVGAASNAVGTINDVSRVAARARDAGALCFVDAVHFAPHRTIDVQAMGCDFLACSAYKFFGPHVGVLWGRSELLESLPAIKLPPAPAAAPERWEHGTLNHEGIAGAAAAVEWLEKLAPTSAVSVGHRRSALTAALKRIRAHETERLQQLLDGLAQIPEVRIFGPPAGAERTPTVGFTVRGHSPEAVARHLGEFGVFVWNGDFYASTVIEGLGLAATGGLIRAGIAPYTTDADVDRLVGGVRQLTRS